MQGKLSLDQFSIGLIAWPLLFEEGEGELN